MPYCPACGREVREDADFCPQCGAPLREPEVRYRRPSGRFPVVQIASLFIGGIIIIASLGVLTGGAAVTWVQREFSDEEGFLTSREVRFHTDSYALVARGVDINIEADFLAYAWTPRPGDFLTVRLVGESNDPSGEIFIGIASEADTRAYLGDVEYEELSDFDWDYNPRRQTQPQVDYQTHPGSAPSGPPTIHSFWVAHASGTGTQTLFWEPIPGNYWVVVMNADGSAGVDVDMRLGARIPILRTVGNGLIGGGLIALMIGGFIVYYGALRRR
jgi:hypothetical protein